MKKFIYLLFFTSYLFSQQKIIYIDNNYKTIDFTTYSKKLDSKLFDIATVSNDTAYFKKLRYAYFFGTLTPKENKQFRKLLCNRFKLDTTKTWLIHRLNSIPNKNKMPKESGIMTINDQGIPTGEFMTKAEFRKKRSREKHIHVYSNKEYLKKIEQEYKKTNPKTTTLVHFYSKNKGYPEKELKALNYFEDSTNLLKTIFTDGMAAYKVILIHPNGEFYVSLYSHKNNELEIRLTKKTVYDRQKKKWLRKINKLKTL